MTREEHNMAGQLGDRVKDTVSGMEGIVTGRCYYLNGCVSLLVEGAHNGKERVQAWLDEQRLQVLENMAFKPQTGGSATAGGPVYGDPPTDPF
jgi:hypothetical protein